jgi:hypothetical protein
MTAPPPEGPEAAFGRCSSLSQHFDQSAEQTQALLQHARETPTPRPRRLWLDTLPAT